MPSRTQHSTQSRFGFPWGQRAVYEVGKSRHQRAIQLRTQTNVLLMTVLVSAIAVGVFIFFNWRGAASDSKAVSCADYPEYCVPFVGGLEEDAQLALAEASGARALDEESHGAEGVVRGFTADMMPFIGDPDAPIHFRAVFDFSCSHCNPYHTVDLHEFVKDYVLSGQATLSVAILNGVGGEYSLTAAQAALCAGEQGAFWEMSDELFRLSRLQGIQNAYSLSTVEQSAKEMGFDAGALTTCILSRRYKTVLNAQQLFATDNGVRGTPTLLVSYGDSGTWTALDYSQRGYSNMAEMTRAAQPVGE
ncbi:MAG: thioredoxin domain-containing protein [Anaerolineae bacterium]|nr:thioredoxin domain-containing protein [Anaerolineae bacterium]MEB2287613.1 thioredoxin domain-containing protein [Anaerolineae bacterium]